METTRKIERGAILVGKFGYEAALFNFYEVVDVKHQKNGSFAVLKQLEKKHRYEPGPDGKVYYDTPEYVSPVLGAYTHALKYNKKTQCNEDVERPAFKKKIKTSKYTGEYCEISTYEVADVWDGTEMFTYNYH